MHFLDELSASQTVKGLGQTHSIKSKIYGSITFA